MAVAETGTGANLTAAGEEEVLSLKDLLGVLRRRIWVVLLAAILLTGAATGYALSETPQYEASARLLLVVRQEGGGEPAPANLQGDAQGIQLLTETMAQALPNERLAQEVIERLDLDESPGTVLDRLTLELVPNTNLIEVRYTDPDPARAEEVVNAVLEVASGEELPVNEASENSVTVQIWERAQAGANPVDPRPARDGLVGLVMGLMVGIALVFLMEYFDDTVRSPREAERASGAPALGTIPKHKPPATKGRKIPKVLTGTNTKEADLLADEDGGPGGLTTVSDPTGPAAEAYRSLRAMVLHAREGSAPRVIVVAGADDLDGKDAVCANLGVVLSQANRETLLLDCDPRIPSAGRLFGIDGPRGLADVVAGGGRLTEASEEPVPGLKVASVAPAPHDDPAWLLEDGRFYELVTEAREDFDHILIDAPPAGAVSGAVAFSSLGSGVLLVVRERETRRDALSQAARRLRIAGAPLLGVVVVGGEPPGGRGRTGKGGSRA